MSRPVIAALVVAGFIALRGPALGSAAPPALPVQQIAKLVPNDGGPNEYFGITTALNGDWAVVGASYISTGGAYVFNAQTGAQVRKLLPNDYGAFDEFGRSVAVSGQRALVGAPSDNDQGVLLAMRTFYFAT